MSGNDRTDDSLNEDFYSIIKILKSISICFNKNVKRKSSFEYSALRRGIKDDPSAETQRSASRVRAGLVLL